MAEAEESMSVKEQLSGAVDTVLSIDHEQFDRVFALLLLAFIGVLLADTPNYSSTGQLFPLVIGVPTALLLVLLLVTLVSPRMRQLASTYAGADLFEVDDAMDEFEEEATSETSEERSLQSERLDVLVICLWTLAFFGTIALIGFLPGTLVFLLAYYRIQADQSIPRTVLFSLLMWAFVILIFGLVLNTPFYTGVFGIEVPLPT
jgi:hypothetical protein